MTVSFMY